MTDTNYTYGDTVIEFESYNEDDYQTLLIRNTEQYNRWSEGLYHKGKAVNIDFNRYMPLHLSLIDLQNFIREGYSVIKADYHSLTFKAVLRKPEEIVASELLELAKTTREAYEQARFERNEQKTAEMLEQAIFDQRKAAEVEAATKLAKATAKKAETEMLNVMEALKATHAQIDAQVTA